MRNQTVCSQILLVFLAIPAVSFRSAVADDQPLVATAVNQVDRDYWFQGEYKGFGSNSCGCCQSYGMQVVALGKNQFQAVLFLGGLPGSGWWTGMGQFPLKGERDGEVLRLAGEQHRIEITNSRAAVREVMASGREYPLCELLRIERKSQTLGACPSPGGIVLFDGSNTDQWKNAKISDDGLLQIGTETKEPYRDFYLHIEFLLPFMPQARGQGRANSGVYIQSRYEVQVLDSFGLKGEHNECAGLYRFKAPDANLCFPPLVWQTYDIEFRSPGFDADAKKCADARVSVWHNGVLVQNHVALANKTGGGAAESPKALPTKLQDHGNPVRFRNIWLIDRTCCLQYQPDAQARKGAPPQY